MNPEPKPRKKKAEPGPSIDLNREDIQSFAPWVSDPEADLDNMHALNDARAQYDNFEIFD